MGRIIFCHNSKYLYCSSLLLLITITTAAAFASPEILRSYSLFEKGNNNNGNGNGNGEQHDRRCIGRCDEIRPDQNNNYDDVIVAPRKPLRFPNTGYMAEVEMVHKTARRSFIFPDHGCSKEEPISDEPTSSADEGETKSLDLRLMSSGSGGDGLGASIWPSGIALASLLSGDAKNTMIKGKRVLELGSGCGLPSLAAKQICGAAKVLATDYWEEEEEGSVVDGALCDTKRGVPANLFGLNLAYNLGSESEVRRLDWHDKANIIQTAEEFRPDIVVGSDLVYEPINTAPLLQTLHILLNCSAKDVMLLSPLPPGADRKALPDFIARLKSEVDFNVKFEELELVENVKDARYRLLYMHITKNESVGVA